MNRRRCRSAARRGRPRPARLSLLDARVQSMVLVAGPPVLVATLDAARLLQVLVDLIDNASKHTPRGGQVTVTLAVSGDGVSLAVRSGGAGQGAEFTMRLPR